MDSDDKKFGKGRVFVDKDFFFWTSKDFQQKRPNYV
mgnify:CR=1 FL=1